MPQASEVGGFNPEGAIPSWCWDEDAARRKLQNIIWANGPVCPRCGNAARFYPLHGPRYRNGLLKCAVCRRHFTVTVGTPFHHTHLPLHRWFLALHLVYRTERIRTIRDLQHALAVDHRTAASVLRRFRQWGLTEEMSVEQMVRAICATGKG